MRSIVLDRLDCSCDPATDNNFDPYPAGMALRNRPHERLLEFRGAGVLHGYLHAPRLNQLADFKPARVASG